MIKIIIAFAAFVFGSVAISQTLQVTGGGGGSTSLTVGSTPITGGSAGCVMFQSSAKVGCDSGLTYAGSGGAVTLGTTGNYINNGNAMQINNSAATQTLAEWGIVVSATTPEGRLASGGIIDWSSSATGITPVDTGISRSATPGVIDIGNGTAQSTAGGWVTANATLTSLTTGTNADFLCLAANGTILLQGSACTISSLRFKPDWKPYRDDAVAKLDKFDIGTFHLQTGPNADPNTASLQAGLSAESVAAIAPECAVYEDDMKTPKSYRQECVLALLVKAIQQLHSQK